MTALAGEDGYPPLDIVLLSSDGGATVERIDTLDAALHQTLGDAWLPHFFDAITLVNDRAVLTDIGSADVAVLDLDTRQWVISRLPEVLDGSELIGSRQASLLVSSTGRVLFHSGSGGWWFGQPG